VGTFALWSVLLVFATLALLCVVGKQLVTSLRAPRRTSRGVFHNIGLPTNLPSE
jgi:hypothetical protein